MSAKKDAKKKAAPKNTTKGDGALAARKCVPCEGGVPKMTKREIAKLLPEIEGWEARNDAIHKSWTFFDFVEALDFVNAMGELAEDEGHHPDFCVHFNRVDVSIWTHAIGGLSENDFILAAKIDEID
jgi:4a-hydroxytetrahydrobiopterin dehydratase